MLFFQRAAANFNCFSYQHHHHHLHPSSTSHIHHLHHLHHLHVTIIFTTTCTHHLHHQHDSHHLDHLHGLFILQDFTHHLCDLHHFNHPLMYRHVGYQLLWTPRALEMTYNVLYIYIIVIYIYIYIHFMFYLNIIYAGADTQVISFYELLQDSYGTLALFSFWFTSSTPRTCKWSTSLSSYKTMRKDLQRQLL